MITSRILKRIRIGFYSLFISILAACSITPDEVDILNKSFALYEHALRWQDFDIIVSFHKNEQEKLTESRRMYLKQFRVTGYDVVYSKIEEDAKHASQVVEIKYYNEARNRVRGLTLNQQWEYDEKKNLWQLTSPLPDFK